MVQSGFLCNICCYISRAKGIPDMISEIPVGLQHCIIRNVLFLD